MSDVLAAVPRWATDLGILAGVLTALVSAFYAIGKFSTSVRNAWGRLMRWLWSGFEGAVARATDDIRADLSKLKHITEYHLGPNGATTPVHERLKRLEEVHDIKDAGDGA